MTTKQGIWRAWSVKSSDSLSAPWWLNEVPWVIGYPYYMLVRASTYRNLGFIWSSTIHGLGFGFLGYGQYVSVCSIVRYPRRSSTVLYGSHSGGYGEHSFHGYTAVGQLCNGVLTEWECSLHITCSEVNYCPTSFSLLALLAEDTADQQRFLNDFCHWSWPFFWDAIGSTIIYKIESHLTSVPRKSEASSPWIAKNPHVSFYLLHPIYLTQRLLEVLILCALCFNEIDVPQAVFNGPENWI